MKSMKKLSGLTLATAAVSMFAIATPMTVSASEDNVHCHGVNACNGNSSCKTATSACKGQNSCKGQGFVSVSKEVCDQLGGEVK